MQLSKTVADIRVNWAVSDAKRDEGLVTPDTIRRYDNLSYGEYGEDNLLDIYVRKDAEGPGPAIVNVHGGAWVYGSKELYQYYCMSLAERGFAVVNLNYRKAPENRFPAAVEDINKALHFIADKGAEYGIDKDRLVLVGDSAGGQLVSHYAAVLTDESLAREFAFSVPEITVCALGLNCGAYDGRKMALVGTDEVFAEYLGIVGGTPSEELLGKIDTVSHITEKYPPAFVMSAVHDFLLPEAEPMYRLLREKGIPAELRICGAEDRPDISHVFHLNMRLPEAAELNDAECAFFRKFVKPAAASPVTH